MSDFRPFSERSEWKDVKPIEQDDGENPVVPIAYSFQFRQTMDYFRAMLLSDERSERSLDLTREVIGLNAGNYTVWYFRRQVLFTLGKDLYAELDYINNLVEDVPKNYQIWHHRRAIVERLNDGSREFDFTAKALREDEKNYHAWAHRQWAIKRFGMWSNELNYINDMLERDLRNNSAWNQRWFVISNTEEFTKEVISRELQYAIDFIKRAPNNESPWNYVRGLMQKAPLSDIGELRNFCISLEESNPTCVFNLAILFDLYIQETTETSKQRAKEIASKLGNQLDPIRKTYWDYRLQQLVN